MKKKRLLIIPARAGSKRIKNKNIKFFFGKPMIHYPLKIAIASKIFDKIHVSTDSKKIRDIVEKVGNFVDFLRPKNLSNDSSSLISVLNYVIDKYEIEGVKFDEIWSILPCSPLLSIDDVRACKSLINKYNKPVIAVSPFLAPINWSFQLKNKTIFKANEKKIRDKKLSKVVSYYDSGQIYCFPVNILKNNKFSFRSKIIAHKLPLERSVDIDTVDDWNLAKILYKGIFK
jgi:CMP-N-acetylneuraminic acid synthetase